MAKAKIEVIGEDKATQELSKIDSALGGLKRTITNVAAGAAAFTVTMQQAFELGKQGASVNQLRDSFTGLLETVGAAPDLLDQLRTASKGTIDDMSLMASTSTLLAGTQGEFAKSLADATPGLLEMAKAAEKLNPSLGDTTFLYDSLARGIKRGSPLILDNLGIVVSLEEAQRKLAAELGKSTDELSKEEQQMALLNEVMDKGRILIDQAGGTTESATDAFTRLEASTKNLTDSLKAQLAPALATAADALNILITAQAQYSDALTKHEQEMRDTAKTWDEYSQEMIRALGVLGYFAKEVDGQIEVFKREGYAAREVTDEFALLSKATFDQSKQYYGLDEAQKVAQQSAAAFALKQEEIKAKTEELTTALQQQALEAGMDGTLQQSWDAYLVKLTALKDENAALRQEMIGLVADGLSPTSEEVQALSEKITANYGEQEKLRESTDKATKAFIYQKAAMDLDTEAAAALARAMGLMSEADYQLVKQLGDLKIQFDENKDGILSADEAAQGYIDRVTLLSKATELAKTDQVDFSKALEGAAAKAALAKRQTDALAIAQAGLAAGLAGRLTKSMDDYQRIVSEAVNENVRLQAEYLALYNSGTATEAQLNAIRDAMIENNNAQVEAQEAMRLTTKEMIYQQAAAGLDANASIELARAMGLLSEQDYAVAATLQRLRAAYDANADGSIDAAEGAQQYIQQVNALHSAVVQLQNAGAGINMQSLASILGGNFIGGATTQNTTSRSNINQVQFTVNYSPQFSFADEYELEQKLRPIINSVLSEHGL